MSEKPAGTPSAPSATVDLMPTRPVLSVTGIVTGRRAMGKDANKPFGHKISVTGLGGTVDFEVGNDAKGQAILADLGDGTVVRAQGFYNVQGEYINVKLDKYVVLRAASAAAA